MASNLRVFPTNERAAVASSPATVTAPILDIISDIDFPKAPAMPAAVCWSDVYEGQLTRWREFAAEMPEYPHAAALVSLLGEASDDVIRQLPSGARDALAYCDDPNISRSRLADTLGKDPALVLRLLRFANSAANGGGQPVLALGGAIARIGMAGTRSVVLAHYVEGLLSRPGVPYEDMSRKVWEHMITTGPIARHFAPAFGADREEAFSVALLHDVGKLVVFDQISALRARQRSPVVLPLAWLAAFLRAAHESLGALAATRWGMGDRAAAAIGDHHRTRSALGANPLAESIFLAERVDHARRGRSELDMSIVVHQGRLSCSSELASTLMASCATDD